jgi:hypothetical protein
MGRDFSTERIPLMRPDLSPLRENPRLETLNDEDFFRDPEVERFISNQMKQSIDWWSMQRKIAASFWPDYFSEGLTK